MLEGASSERAAHSLIHPEAMASKTGCSALNESRNALLGRMNWQEDALAIPGSLSHSGV